MMPDNRSPLMKRLEEIMPKKLKGDNWDAEPRMMTFQVHPIRHAADSFVSWMGDELPVNREELRAMLWVFGEILNGEMERMLNIEARCRAELLMTLPILPTMVAKEK
jgi:hypothetical protein